MTRSKKMLTGLLFCALASAFVVASLDGQVPTKSERAETEAGCEGRVLPRTGKWVVVAEQMLGPRLPGVGESGQDVFSIDSVSKCGEKIEVKMPGVAQDIVFEFVGERELEVFVEDFQKKGKRELSRLTHRAKGPLPNPPFEGVSWLLVVESETEIRSVIWGGLNWQHHKWFHEDFINKFQG